jgi:hypothetical protein
MPLPAAEGGNEHGELGVDAAQALGLSGLDNLGDRDRIGADAVDLGAGHPADVAVVHHAFEHALGVADAAQAAEMTDIGLGGDKGDRHAVADLALAQIGIDHQGEFVGRAEAGGALHGADDHRPRLLDADDDHVIATAVALQADPLVSGDHLVLAIGDHQGIRIVTAAEAVRLAVSVALRSPARRRHRAARDRATLAPGRFPPLALDVAPARWSGAPHLRGELGRDAPIDRPIQHSGRIVSTYILGGLHNLYGRT